MSLKDLMRDKSLITPRSRKTRKVEQKRRSSSGNSADDVLINEAERMTNYISEENRQKITSVRNAYQYGVRKIGSKDDHAQILQKHLIPETTESAKWKASRDFFRMFHSDDVIFYTKNHYVRKIKYLRNKRLISYFVGFDVRTGRRLSVPDRVKYKLMKGALTEWKK